MTTIKEIKECSYPTMARIRKWDFESLTFTELWFGTHAEALRYYNSKRDSDKVFLSPIFIAEVQK
jgi:hypothetical protein